MTDEPSDPTVPDSSAADSGAGNGAVQGSEVDAGANEQPPWDFEAAQPVWVGKVVDGEARGGVNGHDPARSRRPTANGLPTVTARSSDLRSAINGMLSTSAPAPLPGTELPKPDIEDVDPTDEERTDTVTTNGQVDPLEAGAGGGVPGVEPAADERPLVERAKAFPSERPEVVLGVAFVGGLILATIIKRLGRR